MKNKPNQTELLHRKVWTNERRSTGAYPFTLKQLDLSIPVSGEQTISDGVYYG